MGVFIAAQYGTAGEDQLSKSAKKCFEPICSQFDDPTAADKVRPNLPPATLQH